MKTKINKVFVTITFIYALIIGFHRCEYSGLKKRGGIVF